MSTVITLPTEATEQGNKWEFQKLGIVGAPGIGKSGIFARGEKTLVIQTEAGLNHIKCMKVVVRSWQDWEDVWSALIKSKQSGKFPYDTIGIDTIDNFVDFANDKNSKAEALGLVAEIVNEIGFHPDIVAFDPIYTLASSGLETAEACNAITSFFRVVQLYLNCTIIATSHTNRGVRDPENPGKRVGQDMYGNRFLSAFFTGSYHMIPKADGVGATFKLDKNSQKNLEKKFETIYDPSNYCSLTQIDGKFSKKDKLNNFLRACKSQDKEFSYKDMQANSDLSDSQLRGYLIGYLKEIIKESSKGSRGKLLYKCL